MSSIPISRATLRKAARLTSALALTVGLGACQAQYRNHGYVPSAEELSQIAVGVDTRASVEEALGSTGAGSVAGDRGIYYVRSRVRSFAIREPEVVDRRVVAISFNDAGVVSNVESFGLERGRMVPLTRRVTSSPSDDKPFLNQLLGNLGRIGPSGLGSPE
ncbi:outer membrane protein assembly factor BamE [Sulfitobacter sp. D35]|uniref:outer membrane protein assembly factor BamE n=1 Tax=Sulfitobacter sp. D35 TaxID=3083252 RepID=UPI00296F8B4F|nr:outer membrane protein assembly factor BamE [Sulfitobacter sp. D35]MDW4497589.1 outer membrane protein assembly factor BamE [Sulfitobacter sp. D35]